MGIYIDKSKIQYNTDEIIRYMGAGMLDPKSFEYLELKQNIQNEIDKIKGIINPRYKYVKVEINNGILQPYNFELIGKDIVRFLKDIKIAYIIVVTIGQEFERYIRAQKLVNNNLGNIIIDAIGTETVEECADIVEGLICKEGNSSVSSRYSPGYGDFPLYVQKHILKIVDADSIGVYCNEASMMFPQKTVTAVVKLADFNSGCSICENCPNCEFRETK